MQPHKKIPIYMMVLVIFQNICEASDVDEKMTDVIYTDKGPVCGELAKTIQNSSIVYSAYRAIPYAKPPVGPLRFLPPVDIDSWTEIFNATSEPKPCSQVSDDKVHHYNEDCLYLNVYSPKATDDELLAVIVYIYGGAFKNGDSTSSLYGPDFLITDNIVIVTMNYRVGAFGFLSLDTDGVTGNMGLKDQRLALKWVQRNIEKFGGDPKKVTLCGQSAGSASVMLHLLSPASRGLFSGAIAMSGSPLDPWGFLPKYLAKLQAYDLGRKLGIYSFLFNTKKFLEQLRNTSVEQIVKATEDINDFGIPPFVPTYEDPKKAKDVFMTACPEKIFESGDFAKIPVILGFANTELLNFGRPILEWTAPIRINIDYLISFSRLGNPFLNFFDPIIKSAGRIMDDLTNYIIYSEVDVSSDIYFVAGIDTAQKYLAQGSPPIYYYRNSFDYENSGHRVAGIELIGTAHADDVLQILWQANKSQSLDPNSRIGLQRRKMVRMWTNFAKYRNPTPNGTDDPLLNVTWSPSGHKGLHLEIGQHKLSMGPRPSNFILRIVPILSIFNLFGCH